MLARWNYGLVLGASPRPPDPQGVPIAILLGEPPLCWQDGTMGWFWGPLPGPQTPRGFLLQSSLVSLHYAGKMELWDGVGSPFAIHQ